MPRNKKYDIRRLTATAMMIALSVVFERLLPVVDAPEMRLSLGNVPIALTSIAISPVYGAVCGLTADFIGCFVKGYAPNPFLMLAPLLVGVLPYFGIKFFEKRTAADKYGMLSVAVTVTLTNLIASALVTTLGVSFLYGSPFFVLLASRIPTIILGTVLDAAVLYLILKNRAVTKHFSKDRKGGKNRK